MHNPEQAFDDLVERNFRDEIDPNPYGGTPTKPGLTRRGKVAIGTATVLLAGGAIAGYTSYLHASAEYALEAKALDIKAQRLQLERIRALNQIAAEEKKATSSGEEERQQHVRECVNDLSDKLGGWGYQAVSECKDLYPAVQNVSAAGGIGSTAVQAEANQQPPGEMSTTTMLVVGGALAAGVAVAARRHKKEA